MNELREAARCLNPTGTCLADSGCPVCFPKATIHTQLDYLLDELLLAHAQRRKPHCDDRHIIVAALREQIHDAVRAALAAPRAPACQCVTPIAGAHDVDCPVATSTRESAPSESGGGLNAGVEVSGLVAGAAPRALEGPPDDARI